MQIMKVETESVRAHFFRSKPANIRGIAEIVTFWTRIRVDESPEFGI